MTGPASPRLVVGYYFAPRSGSADAARAIADDFASRAFEVTIAAGSRADLGPAALAEAFFAGHEVDAVAWPGAPKADQQPPVDGDAGASPMQASYDDRGVPERPVFASLDTDAFEAQVETWSRTLRLAGAATATLLYVHHLTPINEAAARVCPEVPIIGHIHGPELRMLERAADEGVGWAHAGVWIERICQWAAACDRIVVNSPQARQRAARLLDLDPERFVLVPSGCDTAFSPRSVERREHWHHHLVDEPQGWEPGGEVGSVRYSREQIEALSGPTLIAVGRYSAAKRLPLLIEAFALAQSHFARRTSLVLVGGHPGEWEGEHPSETIRRLKATDVFLAGWHPHDRLPDFYSSADVLVDASAITGRSEIEAMVSGLAVIAADDGDDPASIVEPGRTGWLVAGNDRRALAIAMIEAINQPTECRSRGMRARSDTLDRHNWAGIADQLAGLTHDVATDSAAAAAIG